MTQVYADVAIYVLAGAGTFALAGFFGYLACALAIGRDRAVTRRGR